MRPPWIGPEGTADISRGQAARRPRSRRTFGIRPGGAPERCHRSRLWPGASFIDFGRTGISPNDPFSIALPGRNRHGASNPGATFAAADLPPANFLSPSGTNENVQTPAPPHAGSYGSWSACAPGELGVFPISRRAGDGRSRRGVLAPNSNLRLIIAFPAVYSIPRKMLSPHERDAKVDYPQ